MSIGTELKLVSELKPNGGSEIVRRRQRVVKSINTQISQINDELEGREGFGRKRPSWHWLDEKGTYYVALRYGKQPVELSKGKYAVQCVDLAGVIESLEILKTYVSKGEYDERLASMAKSMRSNFKR
jgi:hypothetical protein